MSKVLNLSDDSGVTWYALPGASAAWTEDGNQIDDSVLGQTYASGITGLVTWSITGNAYYKGYAGYNADIKKSGTITATTGEAMSLVSGKTYAIDDTSKEVWDTDATLTVYDNATPVAASNIESIDYLFGKVTFTSGYSVVGAITIDVSYYPLATFGKGREFTLTQTANALDTSDYQTVQANGGYRTHAQGLRTITMEISGIFYATDDWQGELASRSLYLLEIDPVGDGKSVARGWFRLTSHSQDGNVGENEMETINFVLNVKSSSYDPFAWEHASDTTLSDAVQVGLVAYEAQTVIDAQYLYDGTNGYEGSVIVTEATLTSSVDGMNEFSFSLTGSGAIAAA